MAAGERRAIAFLIQRRYAVLGYVALLIALIFTAVLAFGASGEKPLNGAQSALLALISAIFQGGGAFAFAKQDAANRLREEATATVARDLAEQQAVDQRRVLEDRIASMPSEQAVAIALRRLVTLGSAVESARILAEEANDNSDPIAKERAVGRLSAALSYIEEQVADSGVDWATMYPTVIEQMREQSGG